MMMGCLRCWWRADNDDVDDDGDETENGDGEHWCGGWW